MVHRSMKNGSRVADELYIKRVLMVLEGFLFFSLYSFSCIASNSPTLKHIPIFVSRYALRVSPAISISPASDPARYTKCGRRRCHKIRSSASCRDAYRVVLSASRHLL